MCTEQRDVRELGRSVSKNGRLLQELLAGPKHKAELADVLGVSKSTVYYRMDGLKEYDLVESGAEGYRLTTVGQWIAETYLEALEEMQSVHEVRTVLQEIPSEAVPPRDVLEAASTVLPDGHPEQVCNAFCKWILEADKIRGMLPHVWFTLVERLTETLRTDEMTIDVAVTPQTMENVREYRPEDYRTLLDAESSVVLETDDLPSFGLVVVDRLHTEVGLLGYTDDGYVRGFMRFDGESGYRWADEMLGKYISEPETDPTPARSTTD